MEIRYDRLPEHMRDHARLYIEEGIIPGNFLQLILENDFVHAAGCADDINRHQLLDYAAWLYGDVPIAAWGSRQKLVAWHEMGGTNGE